MMRKERGRETEGKGQGGRGGKRRGERGGGDTHNFGVCVPPPLCVYYLQPNFGVRWGFGAHLLQPCCDFLTFSGHFVFLSLIHI